MAIALSAIRQDVGLSLHECYTGTSSAVSTTTLTDTNLLERIFTDDHLKNAWIKITSGTGSGSIRRITAFDIVTGVLTVSRSWTLSATSTYEIHLLLNPADIDRFINLTLVRCYYVDELLVAPVQNRTQYPLSAYTYITRKGQIFDVLVRYGEKANEYVYVPLSWYRIAEDAGALTVNIPGFALSVQDSGTHTGTGNAATLTDSTKSWATNALVGMTIENTTDLSSAIITANTANTVTATLAGGTDNDWDAADTYSIYSSCLVLRMVRPYDELGSDSATTNCPLEWVRAGALLEIYQWLQKVAPAEDASRYEREQQKAQAVWIDLCHALGPRPGRRVQLGDNGRRYSSTDVVT